VAPETRRSTERFGGRKPRARPSLDQLVPAGRVVPVKSVLVGRFRAEFGPGMGQFGYGTSEGASGGRKIVA